MWSDLDAGKLAKAGVDPVNRLRAFTGFGDGGLGTLYVYVTGGIKANWGLFPVNFGKIIQGDCTRFKGKAVKNSPPKMRACSGLKPIR